MKKITSLLSLVLVTSFGFAQSTIETAKQAAGPTATSVTYQTPASNLAPCDQEVPTNATENGWGPTNNTAVIWADDFNVAAGETLTVNQITLNMLVNTGLDIQDSDIIFYKDSGNGPGDEITTITAVDVTSSTVVGALGAFDNIQLVFDIDPIEFSGAEGTVYWVGFVTSYVGADSYFEVTTLAQAGNPVYVYSETEGFWIPGSEAFADPQPDADFVMKVSGDCNPLSVNSNLLSQVSVYPNPASSVLNFKTPSNVDVTSVVLYDVVGKRVNATYSNGTINVASLSQGVYLLKAETSAGTFTQKIVKQ